MELHLRRYHRHHFDDYLGRGPVRIVAGPFHAYERG